MIETTLIARAIAFAGTSNEMTFSEEAENFGVLNMAMDNVIELATAHEKLNVMAARFSAIEESQGKKLTAPQKKLLELAFSLEGDDNAGLSSDAAPTHSPTEATKPEVTTKESSVDVGKPVQGDGAGDSIKQPTDEPKATFDTPDGQGSPMLTDSSDKVDNPTTQDKPVTEVVNDSSKGEPTSGESNSEPSIESDGEPEVDPLMDAVGAATPPEQAEGVEAALAALGL